ncbi:MAG: alpha/beta hydrolase [Clostridiales bacterium]|nr:alpha/beta hydrolase [Clostridiales bacterium]MCD7722761.1 alpha/beta hydrolase [Clostridiales bacterium]
MLENQTNAGEIKMPADTAALAKHPVVKLMGAFWNMCAVSDEKKHSRQTPPSGVVKVKDIQYAGGDKWHLLDVYYPENTASPLPVIIDIHGGGWMYATKELNEYYCLCLAARGYTVFNINYRLVPAVTVDIQLSDVMLALKWIFENMHLYPCDSEKIMLTGDSAGGQLASYAAVLLQSSTLRSLFGVADIQKKLSALLLTSPVPFMNDAGLMSVYTRKMWGLDYKSKELYKYMDFCNVVDFAEYFPPTYLITSSGDMLARRQTHRAYDLLTSKNILCEIADYPAFKGKSLPHVFSVLNPFNEIGVKAIDSALEFFKSVL